MEEMMTVTIAFIRGETAAASKKKGHAPWKPQDQPKRHVSKRKFDFRGHEITFPPLTTTKGTEGPLVIEAEIGGHMIHHMYVDGGSSAEVLYEHCFNRLRPETKNQMVPAMTSLTGFSGETIWTLGQLRLLVTIGDAYHSTKAWMNFMIVRSLSPYNGIIERPGIREIQAVPSTAHGMLKFPVDGGIVTIRSTILIPVECTTVTTSSKKILREAEVRHRNLKVALHPNFPDQEVAIGGTLSAKGRTELCSLLKENLDIFPWQLADMTGVPRSGAEHWLNIREGYSPVRQKKKARPRNVPKPSKRSLQQLKQHLSELPLLVAPKPKEERIVYLSASHEAISAVLMTERGTVQTLVYFVSRVLQGPELNYTPMEKLVLALMDHGAEPNITSPDGIESLLRAKVQYHIASNNEAKYEALIAGLRIAVHMGVRNVHVSVYSKLVANQVLGTYVAKEDNMVKYLEKTKSLISGFANFSISQVPRKIHIRGRSGDSSRGRGTNMDDRIMEYLKDETLPDDKKEASKLRIKGSCSMHAGPQSMVDKAMRLGYYWPTMHRDARNTIRTCNDCQIHHPVPRNPQQPLTLITAPWPFYKWRIDIVVLLSEGPGKVKFLIVAMDYFTKWIKVKAVMTITGNQVKKFVWDNIVCRFGLPGEIVSDNGKQFSDNPFKDWAKLKMRKYYNVRVRGVTFRPEDFVYHSNEASHAMDGGKLGPKWEGPYEVTEALRDGAYRLRSMDRTILPRTWNIANLKKCYL
ncbi:reverse transcriptase domain-containing protein [Tanacetum coccineum]